MNTLFKIGCMVMLLSVSYQASAVPQFFQAWTERYPDSASSDRGCQLCHQRAEGDNGWNSYGTSIKFAMISQSDINIILSDLESENSDFDEMGLSNIEEIEQGLDPGWRRGAVNSIYFEEGFYLDFQEAPFVDVDGYKESVQELCIPIKSQSRISLICL